jgi:hypothetical protein
VSEQRPIGPDSGGHARVGRRAAWTRRARAEERHEIGSAVTTAADCPNAPADRSGHGARGTQHGLRQHRDLAGGARFGADADVGGVRSSPRAG